MIDKTAIIPAVVKRLKAMEPGTFIDLRTYKRDRSVVIHKLGDDSFRIVEDGFSSEKFEGDLVFVRKLMKSLLKKEFPRSNKVRLYTGTTGGPADGREEP